MMRDGPPGSKRFLPPANLPEQWKDYTALNAEMSPQCPVITEKKEPLVKEE